jgi:hypothetical protein
MLPNKSSKVNGIKENICGSCKGNFTRRLKNFNFDWVHFERVWNQVDVDRLKPFFVTSMPKLQHQVVPNNYYKHVCIWCEIESKSVEEFIQNNTQNKCTKNIDGRESSKFIGYHFWKIVPLTTASTLV